MTGSKLNFRSKSEVSRRLNFRLPLFWAIWVAIYWKSRFLSFKPRGNKSSCNDPTFRTKLSGSDKENRTRPYGLQASFLPLVGLPLAVPLPEKLKKRKGGSVERTYQSSAPEGCTYQSCAPEGCTYQSSAPEGCTYQSSAPEGCTHQSSAPEECTYQSSAPEGCTYP
ncbi:NBS-LRR type resistance protein [Cucumis melo var. makuwa]|uniref:NBS-LRR type resistance protein n=1 Tax=Cucumis melo var. makuwa TaxID=1194695 RepID=A0A5A7UZG9_CUCMM|nr:NBS-LRR type resistance protein [Cucumis melo var. makuwa]